MGIFSSKPLDLQKDINDLTGRVAIITGGNTGIGYETVKALAKRGAKVYMAARNESKALGAITALEHEGVPLGSVVWLKLDLNDLPGVKKAAEEILRKEKRLDILVNNAALQFKLEEETYPEGVSEFVLTNYLGPWLFTTTLLPLLKETAKELGSDVRIINVSSASHQQVPKEAVRFRNLEDLNNGFKSSLFPQITHYAFTKLQTNLFMTELVARLKNDNILTLSLHPGLVNTSYTYKLPLRPISSTLINLFFVTPERGAITSIIAAASPILKAERDTYNGAYLVPYGKIGTPSTHSQDSVLAAELWQTTEAVIGEILDHYK
ncbi:hypothetical protein AX16_010690 [Volvariella volvacea WC 439]|nr:hypothetical protein AX16_010690 [Volvariella volvacea WC 439]